MQGQDKGGPEGILSRVTLGVLSDALLLGIMELQSQGDQASDNVCPLIINHANIFLSAKTYLERWIRSIKVAANKLGHGRLGGRRTPRSETAGTSGARSRSRQQRTSSQVWRKGEGGQSIEVDQLERLPMLNTNLLTSVTRDSGFHLRPQVERRDKQSATSSSTFCTLFWTDEKQAGFVAAIWSVLRACSKPSTRPARSAGGAAVESSLPKTLKVNGLCQSSLCFCTASSSRSIISVGLDLEPDNCLNGSWKDLFRQQRAHDLP